MRNILIILIGTLIFTSCKDSSELYDYPINKIGFLLEGDDSKILNKTFIYDKPDVVRDTVYVKMRTMGFVTPHDRPVLLEQMEATEPELSGMPNAVSGVHYVAFDDPDYAKLAVVEAGKAEIMMPIILLRDPSLREEQVVLKIRIADNAEFVPINPQLSEKVIVFTDMLMQPAHWKGSCETMFGKWGLVKYRFMLDNSPDLWDDDFIDLIINDYPYVMYWRNRFNNLLDKENAKRKEQGLEPLSEKPEPGETEGILVSFP